MFRFTSGAGTQGPASPFDEPSHLGEVLTRRILPLVTSPGRYIGGELGADREGWQPSRANILLAFPDAYEVGMSHQGLRILHTLLLERDDAYCDLAFAPWPDMEERLRAEGMPLFGLESRRPLAHFDLVGFSLGYELAYTNMLNMIDLAGSPVRARDRGEDDPIFVAGGSCAMNPTVVGPFLDLVLLGDGEEAVLDFAAIIARWKAEGGTRAALLDRLREVDGVWHPGVTGPVRSRVLQDLNKYPPPGRLVPVVEPVHDRLALEVMRGCVRGCRFCQAGMITRPVRERNPQELVEAARTGLAGTGYCEVSLLSLSTSDFSGLGATVAGIQDGVERPHTNLVLPSLRVDSVDEELYERIGRERPASFTFAPEAGSQRLRDVINKNITAEDIVTAAGQALSSGVKTVKLYFMIGLPTETNEDLDELVALVGRVVALAPRGGSQIHVSISPFSPKSHTTFQWAGQISGQEIERRNNYVARPLRRMNVKVGLRDPEISVLEGILGLGGAVVSDSVEHVWRQGARFDGWSEWFDFSRWEEAFAVTGLDTKAILGPRDPEAPLPWDTVDCGVDREFLARDWRRAQRAATLHDCRLEGACYDCSACAGDVQHVFAALEQLAVQDTPPPPVSPAKATDAFDPRNSDPAQPGRELKKWCIWRNQTAAKCWYRAEFAKTGDMIFLGHLDFQRQLQLALRRSGLPVAHSKGYHPHPLLKFGPPLPVGISGRHECFDLAFRGQVPGWVELLNAELPAGIRIRRTVVIGAQTPSSIDKMVKRFDYAVTLPPMSEGGPEGAVVAAALDVFAAADRWPCLRHRPKGDIEIDARPLVPAGGIGLMTDAAGGTVLRLTLMRGESGVVLPVYDFLAALLGDALPEPRHCIVVREGCYGHHDDGRWLTPVEEVGETSLRFWLGRHLVG